MLTPRLLDEVCFFPGHTNRRAKSLTPLFSENLLDGSRYITSFPVAGYTNKFIAYMHLIYLGILSNRIPIIPPILPPGWVPIDAGIILFGDIYNLTTLRDRIRHPVLEWSDVKAIPSTADVQVDFTPTDPVEQLGCWSVRPRSADDPTWVRGAENVLKIDLSFTRVPSFSYFNQSDENEIFVTFPALASLVYAKHPHPSFHQGPLMRASRLGSELRPEEQLACFDFLYYASSGVQRYEFENRWSPAWNTVGTHLHFTQPLVDLTDGYLRRAMNIGEAEDLPPMITIHLRRNDFKDLCPEGKAPPCFIPLSKYQRAVTEIQEKLLETQGISVSRVLVTSDEKDLSFWEEISSFGWSFFNHTAERTVERFSKWHPLLIDKVALSQGIGFIGTNPSTFSILNAFRVEDWNNGVTKMLRNDVD
ncbi:hypothetical protein DFP72DRAFT_808302 [Ephemerocybe angulata]|uniref:O-fucosyltransferase family protein n=1 Tax=Ephemerocybe angulata TaxID=980116 RepID=A0A8H6I507_9AGAR|nr:hypothetical protein DFP72DRAFT_808302 [Tulosesus angulatus]